VIGAGGVAGDEYEVAPKSSTDQSHARCASIA
jgi:hypothetical protein